MSPLVEGLSEVERRTPGPTGWGRPTEQPNSWGSPQHVRSVKSSTFPRVPAAFSQVHRVPSVFTRPDTLRANQPPEIWCPSVCRTEVSAGEGELREAGFATWRAGWVPLLGPSGCPSLRGGSDVLPYSIRPGASIPPSVAGAGAAAGSADSELGLRL